jgi:hypothetical protein
MFTDTVFHLLCRANVDHPQEHELQYFNARFEEMPEFIRRFIGSIDF